MPKGRARWLAAAVAAVVALGVLAGVYWVARPAWSRDVVATVNGEPITKEDLYEAMLAAGGGRLLEQLIEERLVEQEAARRGITVGEDEIAKEIEQLKQRYGGDEGFKAVLQQFGMTEERLRREVRVNLLVRKLLAPEIQVTEQDVRRYYEEHKDEFREPEQARARHILVKDRATAEQLLARIRNGEAFEDVARSHSQDAQTAQKGGDLGWFPRGQMDPKFDQAVFSAAPNSLVGPVQTAYGFHVIQVLERKPARLRPFEEVKEEIRQLLVDRALRARMPAWLEELKAKAKIERRLEAGTG